MSLFGKKATSIHFTAVESAIMIQVLEAAFSGERVNAIINSLKTDMTYGELKELNEMMKRYLNRMELAGVSKGKDYLLLVKPVKSAVAKMDAFIAQNG